MSSPAPVLLPRRGILPAAAPQTDERRLRRRVYLTYGVLFCNGLTFYPGYSFLPIPGSIGKAIAQSMLPLALVLALSLNRKIMLRPNVFLCLVTLIVLGAFLTAMQPQHFGTVFRTFRLAGFVTALWLMTPWWGRRDLLLVRAHLYMLGGVLGSVVVGLLLAPSTALRGGNTGRLGGALWPVPPTQVAHYAGILIGLVVVLWFCGQLRSLTTALISAAAMAILILTHTRTALIGLVAGVLIAGMSLIVAKARVRRLFAAAGAITAVAVLTLSAFITTWLARGQTTEGLSNLTGRTKVWGPLLAAPRNKFQEIFGFGLGNSSFNGLPIDSNWLASYEAQGLFGVVVCAAILVFLLITAYFQPRGLRRALALFLVTYCLVASFTEVGFTDVSIYLLDLTVAASLLVPFSRGSEVQSVPGQED
ncbi:MAG TPA: hypothetical protein VFV73_06990 [Streptosporangiaceae bacterium]|nr:hypothetical protein [Streptosporangiaceae bacterium]